MARPGPGCSPAGRKQARTGRSDGRAAGTGFQAPSAPLRARPLERPGAEALQQALHTHPTLQRKPAPVYFPPLGSQRGGQGPAQRRNPARPALGPQTEDLRRGGAVGTDAGVRLQAACRTPWQLGTREALAAEAAWSLLYMGSHPGPPYKSENNDVNNSGLGRSVIHSPCPLAPPHTCHGHLFGPGQVASESAVQRGNQGRDNILMITVTGSFPCA